MRAAKPNLKSNVLGVVVAIIVTVIVGAVVLQPVFTAQNVRPVTIEPVLLLLRVAAIVTTVILFSIAIRVYQ